MAYRPDSSPTDETGAQELQPAGEGSKPMDRQLARNLYHLMRGAARRTPVDRLKKKGHKTVSVLNFRDIQELIERAITGTLRRRGVKLDAPEIHEEVRLEFLALMRERDSLKQTVDSLMLEKEQLANNREELSAALEVATREYQSAQKAAERQSTAGLDGLRSTVEAQLRELLASAPEGANGLLGEQAIALVVQAIEQQRQAAVQAAHEQGDDRLRTMQRRIEKLKSKLAETEDMLARARAASTSDVVEGEPVDAGLKHGDPNFNTKKELLSQIFRLNVELREMLKTN